MRRDKEPLPKLIIATLLLFVFCIGGGWATGTGYDPAWVKLGVALFSVGTLWALGMLR